ncbi:MAG: beta-ketoacyl-ACP synthase III [Alphaproteobacteria bacterium]|nr:beta-ketoacyl-ACP synthase III [Alphaproteobacteria bacterium]
MRKSVIQGCGAYLPERVMTNDELARMVDTSNEWIVDRTGIHQRHIAAEGELTSDLAVKAADQALAESGMAADEIDLIVVATTTPDSTFPATAARVQGHLGANNAFAFDLQAVCSGFVFGLATVDNFLKLGQADTALVIGAEIMSRIVDWTDRTSCVLFGDGAGAVVVRAEEGAGNGADRGILSSHLHSDGRYHDIVYVDGGVSSTQTAGLLRMISGQELFRHAVTKLSAVLREALEANDLDAGAIDWLVPHQANRRIIDGTARKFNIPPERVVITVDRHANTSAASIPLALTEATADGRIKAGDLVAIEAIGGGLTWGAGLIRW